MYKLKKYEKVTVAAIVLLGRNVRWFLFSHGQIFRIFRGGYPEKAGGGGRVDAGFRGNLELSSDQYPVGGGLKYFLFSPLFR